MILFTLLVTIIISLLALSVYYYSSLERQIVFNNRLKSRANYTAQLYSLLGDSSITVLTRVDSNSVTGSLPQRSIAIFTNQGNIPFKFANLDTQKLSVSKDIIANAITKGEVYFQIGNREAIALEHHSNKKSFVVVVAAYDEDGLQRIDHLLKILLVSLLAAIILTAFTGLLFSRRLLKPLSQIINEVNDISSYNLSHRIKVTSGQDELTQLANTFNELLERLQKSFDTQKRFISNASHELSTPLTSISSQLEVTLQKERITSDYHKVLYSISEDVLHMRELTKSLLEIAKADSHAHVELTEVRIDEVLLKITSEIKKINSTYQVELHFGDFPEDEKDCIVFGNFELLYSAIKNIVENGCKYSPDKRSRVELHFANRNLYITIKNQGNVIAEEEIQTIFQPFFRGTNSKAFKGFGLGLALAKSIARLHKGNISVKSDKSQGTIFTIEIPSYNAIQQAS